MKFVEFVFARFVFAQEIPSTNDPNITNGSQWSMIKVRMASMRQHAFVKFVKFVFAHEIPNTNDSNLTNGSQWSMVNGQWIMVND